MAFPFDFSQLGYGSRSLLGHGPRQAFAPGAHVPFAFGGQGSAPAFAAPPAVHGWQAKLPTGSTWTPGQGAPPWANGGGGGFNGAGIVPHFPGQAEGSPTPIGPARAGASGIAGIGSPGVASSYSGGGALSTLAGGGAGDLPSYPARQGALASLAGGGAGDMPPPAGVAPTSYSTAPRLPGISPSTMTTAQRTQQLAQVLGGYRGTM